MISKTIGFRGFAYFQTHPKKYSGLQHLYPVGWRTTCVFFWNIDQQLTKNDMIFAKPEPATGPIPASWVWINGCIMSFTSFQSAAHSWSFRQVDVDMKNWRILVFFKFATCLEPQLRNAIKILYSTIFIHFFGPRCLQKLPFVKLK